LRATGPELGHPGVMRSTLELRVGGLPLPRGDGRGWHYRHAIRPEGVTVLDRQAVTDFMEYETANGREVSVTADPELAEWPSWRCPVDRPVPGSQPIQCCTHVYPDGCGSPPLVCHGAPLEAVAAILAGGTLRSSVSLTGMTPEALAARVPGGNRLTTSATSCSPPAGVPRPRPWRIAGPWDEI